MENINTEELLFKYKLALQTIRKKFEIMYNELNNNNDYNCIEHIKSRIKSIPSIYNKLIKIGYDITTENIKNKIHDIAGIRIICSFMKDIETVERLIKQDEDIIITKRKDYITTPKESGYSSLHLIVKIPVVLSDKKEYIEVEIQLRTIAMDMWASLEHKLCYKNKKVLDDKYKQFIKDFSVTTRNIDYLMEKMIIESDKYNLKEQDRKQNLDKIKIIEQISFLKYELAEKQLYEKIQNISSELSNTKNINPIEHIKSRIKKPNNIVKKLEKLSYEVTEENMNHHIHDLVGTRIVCSFLSDLEEIKYIIENDSSIKIIKRKNYIDNPKPNGYRSFHYNVLIPIKMNNKIEYVEAEIQIRTIAMDMWATLEHKICYKKSGNIPEEMKDNLKEISNYINIIDRRIDSKIKDNKNDNIKKLRLKKHI